MTELARRLRMFAGPNGSGKSTFKSLLRPELLGVYVNPDEIEAKIKRNGYFQFSDYGIADSPETLTAFFKNSNFLINAGLGSAWKTLRVSDQKIWFEHEVNSYLASATASCLRDKLMLQGRSYTLETVMSSPDKVALFKQAKSLGYRTYLYYVATRDPQINLSRVKDRVAQGGHDVPPEKIESRYHRSLSLLFDAVKNTDRAYIFDNSAEDAEKVWIAEVTNGWDLNLKINPVPQWFKRAVLNKIG